MKKVICFFVCVLICIGFSVKAQVTTSVLGGKIIDDQNEYVIGATVVAVHEPSGTMYGAVTNVDGRYTIQGMRTGGPYKVEISYVGYKKAIFTDIRLELGNIYVLNATLYPSSEQLGEVVVTADAKANIGASENFSTGRIQETPTVDRNIYDVVKNMPMAMTSKNGGITFAGSNNRYNSFQIDGTVSNDVSGWLRRVQTVVRRMPIRFRWMPSRKSKWWSLLSMFAKAVLPEVASTLLPNRETTHTMHRSILILRMKVFTESTMLIKIT